MAATKIRLLAAAIQAPMPIFAACMFVSAVLFALIDPTRPLIPTGESSPVVESKEPACV